MNYKTNKTATQITIVNPSLSIIASNVNGLNSSVRSHQGNANQNHNEISLRYVRIVIFKKTIKITKK